MPSLPFLSEPENMTSSDFFPRRVFMLCSPKAQRTASATFDLPEPFGPTIAVIPRFVEPIMPGKTSTFLLAKDLNPWISNFSRYIFIFLSLAI